MCRSEQYSIQTARRPEILKKHQKEICKFVPEKKNRVEKQEMSVEKQTYGSSSSSIIFQ